MAGNWQSWLLRGVAAAAFGVLALARPDAAATVLVLGFGLYAVVEGVLGIWAALTGGPGRLPMIAWAVLSLVAGAIALLRPETFGLTAVVVVGTWALVTGPFQILAGIALRDRAGAAVWLILGGILSLLFGVVAVTRPVEAGTTIVLLTGAYAVVLGLLLVAFAVAVRPTRQQRGAEQDFLRQIGEVR